MIAVRTQITGVAHRTKVGSKRGPKTIKNHEEHPGWDIFSEKKTPGVGPGMTQPFKIPLVYNYLRSAKGRKIKSLNEFC